MSDVLPADMAAELARSDRAAYFEQRIFVLSPFGTAMTALLIFLVLAGSYLLAMRLDGAAILATKNLDTLRLALTLSLLMTVILAAQRFARQRERADVHALARVLKGGLGQAKDATKLTPDDANLLSATLVGLVIGAAADWFFYFHGSGSAALFSRIWFSLITLLLVLSFVRGAELTRTGGRGSVAMIKQYLVIDLLRIEELSVWGRGAARFALIWFSISAVSCLLFVSASKILTAVFLLGCLTMGIVSFMRMMEPIHRQIRAAKAAEMERVRADIDRVRGGMAQNADLAVRLQGLLAYETRIAAVPEWPFDQTTLVRVGASALILTVPWFGQAVAGYVIEHLAH